jgi:hypothetical protein
MQHVLRADDQLDRLADRDVQLVDLALAADVLRLPHPALADDVDLHRVRWRRRDLEVQRGAPHEHHHRDDEGDERPGQLEDERAVDRRPDLVGGATPEADGEHDHQRRDEHGEEGRDRDEEQVQRVHARGVRRALRREERQI